MIEPIYDRGGIQIFNADCRDVLPQLEAGSVDMIWTDPPYGHGNLNGDLAMSRIGVKGARQAQPVSIVNDEPEDWEPLVRAFLVDAQRILKPDCCCCCCCCGGGGPSPAFARMALWLDDYLSFFHAVVWDKSGRGNGLGWRYRRNYEFVMVAHRKGGKLAWADDTVAVPNIVRTQPVANDFHPTTKPVPLVAQFIRWHTKPGDLVVDPFMGSGTTALACKQLGRRFLGVESKRRYCDIAIERLRQDVMTFETAE